MSSFGLSAEFLQVAGGELFLRHVMAESEELMILCRQSMGTHSGQAGAAQPLFNFLPASVPLSLFCSPVHILSSLLPQSLCCR